MVSAGAAVILIGLTGLSCLIGGEHPPDNCKEPSVLCELAGRKPGILPDRRPFSPQSC